MFAISRELRWLIRQARPYRNLQIASILCITMGSWLYLLDPLVIKWLLDRVLPKKDLRGLLVALLLILLIYVGRAILSSAGSLLTTKASQKLILDLRRRLLNHLNKLSANYHDTESVGARFYLFKEPMEELSQLGADLLPSVLRTTILTVLVLTTMLFLNAHLTLSILPLLPVFLFARHKYRMRLRSEADAVQERQKTASSFLQEHLHCMTQIQLLAAEKRQERYIFRLFGDAVRAQWRLWRTAAEFSGASSIITVLGIVTVLGVGGKEYFDGRLTLGGLVAFYTYLTRLFEPLSGAVELYSRLQRVGASVRKVTEVFGLESSVKETQRPIRIGKETQGAISFDDVSFCYDGRRPILRGLTFRISPRGRVALAGANGSGKSTTAKLIARLYDPNSGLVCIDGVDIRSLRLRDLRELACYLPQHAVLFDADLRQNLVIGNPKTSENELTAAVRVAELDQLISKLQRGLREHIGPGGNQLSGGERQRVAIARAILQKPRILVLDEATSFLDCHSEERILSTLGNYLRDTTLVVISHHLSALRWVDEILVLEGGLIAVKGTHVTLSETDVYKELFRVNRRSPVGTAPVEVPFSTS